jgi:hypothetical protein
MKSMLAIVALSIAAAVTLPAFAQDPAPKTQAECEKHQDMRWDPGSKTCIKK